MATFPERLRYLRNRKGWSQQRLADELKISKSSVNMYERGEREPGNEMMEAIADIFNVDMDYLYGRSDVERRHPISFPGTDESKGRPKSKLRSVARLESSEVTPEQDEEISNYIDYLLSKRGRK